MEQLPNIEVDPTVAIIIPVLIIIGWVLKKNPKVQDWLIIYILFGLGVVGGIAITGSDIIKGIISGCGAAMAAISVHQAWKQAMQKRNEDK